MQPHVALGPAGLVPGAGPVARAAVTHNVRLDPVAQAGQGGQHGPVRLGPGPGHQAVAALRECVRDEELQPAQLVAAQPAPARSSRLNSTGTPSSRDSRGARCSGVGARTRSTRGGLPPALWGPAPELPAPVPGLAVRGPVVTASPDHPAAAISLTAPDGAVHERSARAQRGPHFQERRRVRRRESRPAGGLRAARCGSPDPVEAVHGGGVHAVVRGVLAEPGRPARASPVRTAGSRGGRRYWPASVPGRPGARPASGPPTRRRPRRPSRFPAPPATRLSRPGRPARARRPSRPGRRPAWARITRDRVTRCSEISGIALVRHGDRADRARREATPRSSPISGRCSWYTSLPIFAAVAEMAASSQRNSATPSRAVIHGTTGTPSPSCRANASSRSRARSPQNSMVPSAPPSWTTSQRRRPCRSRCRCRSSSAAQTAALNPNVIGSRAARGSARTSACPGAAASRARGRASGSRPARRCPRPPGHQRQTRCPTGPAPLPRNTPTPGHPPAAPPAAP